MALKLITEVNEEVNYLEEEKDGKKGLYIEGIFMQADMKNRNGRMYAKRCARKEVKDIIKNTLIRIERMANSDIHKAQPSI